MGIHTGTDTKEYLKFYCLLGDLFICTFTGKKTVFNAPVNNYNLKNAVRKKILEYESRSYNSQAEQLRNAENFCASAEILNILRGSKIKKKKKEEKVEPICLMASAGL